MTASPSAISSDDDLLALGNDIANGKVFVDRYVHTDDRHYLPTIFGDLAAVPGDDPPELVYQYYGVGQEPIRVKGYPVFATHRRLSPQDMERLHIVLHAIAWVAVNLRDGLPGPLRCFGFSEAALFDGRQAALRLIVGGGRLPPEWR